MSHRFPIKDWNLKTPEEALVWIKRVKEIANNVWLMTDGADEHYICSDVDELPIFNQKALAEFNESLDILRSMIAGIQVELISIDKKLEEKVNQTVSEKIKIIMPVVEAIKEVKPNTVTAIAEIPPEPKPKTEITVEEAVEPYSFAIKERGKDGEVLKKIEPSIPTKKFAFKCSNCNEEFEADVPIGKKVVRVTCPKCGHSKKLARKYSRKVWIVTGIVGLGIFVFLLKLLGVIII